MGNTSNDNEKVVTLKFDNAQFEKGVKQSKKTLESLQNSISKAENTKSLDKIGSQVESLNSKFSTLGIIGMSAISSVTDKVVGLATDGFGKLLNVFATIPTLIGSGGLARAMDIEKARFQIEGLHKDWNAAYEDINYGVQDTAYGFNEAAMVAAQLAASNVDFGDDMKHALLGVSGVAAMTGSSYAEIGSIFSTIAGNGKVMGDQLNRLAYRGLNVASEMAKIFSITEEEFRKYVSAGTVDAQTFFDAMNYLYGSHAKDANDTLIGIQANVKAAFKKIGQMFVEDLIAQNGPLVNMFKAIKDLVNNIKNDLGGVAKVWLYIASSVLGDVTKIITKISNMIARSEGLKDFFVGIENILFVVRKVLGEFFKAFNKVFGKDLDKDLFSFGTAFKNITEIMKKNNKVFLTFGKIFTAIFSAVRFAFVLLGKVIGVIKVVYNAINNVFSSIFKNMPQVNNIFDLLAEGIIFLTSNEKSLEVISLIFEKIGLAAAAIIGVLGDVITIVYDNIKNFKGLESVLNIITAPIHAVVGGLIDLFGAITGIDTEIAKQTAFEVMSKAISKIAEFIKLAVSKIKEFIEVVKSKIDFSKFEIFGKKIKDVSDTIDNSKVIKKVEKLHKAASKKVNTSGWDKFFEKIKKIVETVKNSEIFKAIQNSFKFIGMVFKALGSMVEGAAKSFNTFFGSMDKDTMKLATLGGIVAVVTKFLTQMFNSIKGLKKNNTTMIAESLSKAAKNMNKEKVSSIFLKVGIGLLALCAGLYLLSGIETEKLTDIMLTVSMMVGSLVGTMAAMKSVIDPAKTSAISSAILKFATSLLIVAVGVLIIGKALKMMSGIEDATNNAISILIVLGGVAAILGILAKNLSTTNVEDFLLLSLSLTYVAKACVGVAIAVLIIGQLPTEKMIPATFALGMIMLAITALAQVSKGLDWKSVIALGLAMQLMGFAMIEIAGAVYLFGSMDPDKLSQGGLALGAVAAGFILLTYVAGKLKASSIIATAGLFAVMTTTMLLMSGVIAILGSMDTGRMAQGVLAILSIMAAFSVLMIITKLVDPQKLIGAAAGMAIIAGTLLVVAGAIAILASVGGGAWDALKILGIALAAFIVVGFLAEKVAPGLIIFATALLMIGAAFGIVVISIGAAAFLFSQAMVTFAIGLEMLRNKADLIPVIFKAFATGIMSFTKTLFELGTETITAFFDMVRALIPGAMKLVTEIIQGVCKTIQKNTRTVCKTIEKVLSEGLKVLFAITPKLIEFVVTLVDELLKALATKAPTIIASLLKIIVLLVEAILEKIPVIIKYIFDTIVRLLDLLIEYVPIVVSKLLDIIAAVIDGLAIGLPDIIKSLFNLVMEIFKSLAECLKDADPEVFLNAFVCIGLLDGIALELTAMAALAGPAIVGLGEMAVLVDCLTSILAALGAISRIPGLTELVEDGGEFLIKIGGLVGEFVGTLIGGIAAGMTSGLPAIAMNLSLFAALVQPFIEAMRKIDPSVFEGVGIIIATIMGICAAEIFETITKFIVGGNPLSKFGLELVVFGGYLSTFATITKNVNGFKVSLVADAMASLFEAAQKIPNSGGLVSLFTGENDIAVFGKKLVDFAPDFVKFSNEVGKINDTKNAIEAMKLFARVAEVAHDIPNDGGVAGFFAGDNDIKTFGMHLYWFGGYFKDFANDVGVISTSTTDKAVHAMNLFKAVVDVAKYIPNSGGLAGAFAGENDIGEFGKQLKNFSPNFKDFIYACNIEESTVDKAIYTMDMFSELVDIAGDIPNSGGIVSAFTGDNSLTDFAEELKDFADPFTTFVKSAATLNASGLGIAREVVSIIVDLMGSIGKQGGFAQVFTGESNLAVFGANLVNFADYFLQFVDKLKEVGTNVYIVKDVADIINSTKLVGIEFVDDLIDRYYTAADEAKEAVLNLFVKIKDGFSNKNWYFVNYFVNPIRDAIDKIRGYYDGFKAAGSYLIDGLASGIRSKSDTVISAVEKVAKDTLKKGIMITWDEHSPSKKAIKLGGYLGEGLAIGISKTRDMCVNAASEVSDDSLNIMQTGIEKVFELIQNEGDFTPVIAPVLDLSNVKKGASDIGSMLNKSNTLTLDNVKGINAKMNESATRASNDDVVSAIDKLAEVLANSNGGTTNIINGITYDDGSSIQNAVGALVQAATIGGRI